MELITGGEFLTEVFLPLVVVVLLLLRLPPRVDARLVLLLVLVAISTADG